jgi:hypothetical protein
MLLQAAVPVSGYVHLFGEFDALYASMANQYGSFQISIKQSARKRDS